ncbi:hypothetical protein V8F06_000031 [Rhypophila decipiens]
MLAPILTHIIILIRTLIGEFHPPPFRSLDVRPGTRAHEGIPPRALDRLPCRLLHLLDPILSMGSLPGRMPPSGA